MYSGFGCGSAARASVLLFFLRGGAAPSARSPALSGGTSMPPPVSKKKVHHFRFRELSLTVFPPPYIICCELPREHNTKST